MAATGRQIWMFEADVALRGCQLVAVDTVFDLARSSSTNTASRRTQRTQASSQPTVMRLDIDARFR